MALETGSDRNGTYLSFLGSEHQPQAEQDYANVGMLMAKPASTWPPEPPTESGRVGG